MRKWIKAGLGGMAAVMLMTAGCTGRDAATDATAESSGEVVLETEEYVAEGSVTLGEYKNIPVTVTQASVTDEEVDEQIESARTSVAALEDAEDGYEAQLGDEVNIDYKGIRDGVAFDGGSAEGHNLGLGSGQFIPGFEEGLIGVKKGDKISVDVTFPDPYPNNPDLAGQPVVFEVTVNSVKKNVIPELNDEFAKEYGDVDTVEELRESVRQSLLEQKQAMYNGERDSVILEAIVANSEVVCATDEIEEYYNSQVQSYEQMAGAYGLDLATYAGMMGMEETAFRQQLRDTAKLMVAQESVLKEIASVEQITADESDELALAASYGFETVEELMTATGADAALIADTALMTKVMQFLADAADVTFIEEQAAPSGETVPTEEAEPTTEADPTTDQAAE